MTGAQEFFYTFLTERYTTTEIAQLVAEDIVLGMWRRVIEVGASRAGIQTFGHVQPYVDFFAKHLMGTVDPSTARYYVLVCSVRRVCVSSQLTLTQIVDTINFKTLRQASKFFIVIFPTLNVNSPRRNRLALIECRPTRWSIWC